MWRRVAFIRTDISEEHITSIIRMKRGGEIGTLAVTSKWSTLRCAIHSSEKYVIIRVTCHNITEDGILHSHRREDLKFNIALTGWNLYKDVMCFLWGTNWVCISQKTTSFIVTAVKTSNLTRLYLPPLPPGQMTLLAFPHIITPVEWLGSRCLVGYTRQFPMIHNVPLLVGATLLVVEYVTNVLPLRHK
jgi:hypothetical protein